jgi:hypothetical protein
MCFSATASFSAAAVCGAIGVLTVRRASRPDLMLALIPVIFALHQASRGLKVAPVCWFVRDYLVKYPEYRDLVAA